LSESLSIAAGLCGSKYIFKFIYIIIYINYIIAISDAYTMQNTKRRTDAQVH